MKLFGPTSPLTGVFSLFAVIVSILALYLTELKGASVRVVPAETAFLGRDSNGGVEVLLVSMTVANSGARSGVLRDVRLTVSRADPGGSARRRVFFAAETGVRPGRGNAPFAPISIEGRAARSQPILFYPIRSEAWLLDAAGEYDLTLEYVVESGEGPIDFLRGLFGAAGPEATSRARREGRRSYRLKLPYISVPELIDGGLIRMTPPGWSGDAAAAN